MKLTQTLFFFLSGCLGIYFFKNSFLNNHNNKIVFKKIRRKARKTVELFTNSAVSSTNQVVK